MANVLTNGSSGQAHHKVAVLMEIDLDLLRVVLMKRVEYLTYIHHIGMYS